MSHAIPWSLLPIQIAGEQAERRLSNFELIVGARRIWTEH